MYIYLYTHDIYIYIYIHTMGALLVISWFQKPQEHYTYTYHRPELLSLKTNLAILRAPHCIYNLIPLHNDRGMCLCQILSLPYFRK